MSSLSIYIQLGLEHITDVNGYDHILFIMALMAVFNFTDTKKILILVTAFTLGHSITLALASLKFVQVNTAWVEFLIPVTILLTGIGNIFHNSPSANTYGRSIQRSQSNKLRYIITVLFGLIHGLGFSNFLSPMIDKNESILFPLLSFNIGLELGQIAIVLVVILANFVLVGLARLTERDWNMLISGATGSISILLIAERIPF
ncbi:HupE/UreJ family protein [Limibacter armeniacum]|uniref:HupE/UreJ family protein n=1 Tax=Limibacter armeniacum TaxID=466084 RepID=UPI002FE6BB09